MKNLIFFLRNQNIRARSEITEPKLKIPQLDPKSGIIRTSPIPLYRNI